MQRGAAHCRPRERDLRITGGELERLPLLNLKAEPRHAKNRYQCNTSSTTRPREARVAKSGILPAERARLAKKKKKRPAWPAGAVQSATCGALCAANNETPNIRLNFQQRRKTGNVAICTKKRRLRPSRRSPSALLSQQRTKITTEAPKKLMKIASIPTKDDKKRKIKRIFLPKMTKRPHIPPKDGVLTRNDCHSKRRKILIVFLGFRWLRTTRRIKR